MGAPLNVPVMMVNCTINPPAPCLWQAPVSAQNPPPRKTRPAIRRSGARWTTKALVRCAGALFLAHGMARPKYPPPAGRALALENEGFCALHDGGRLKYQIVA